ncbi:MBL fold metallo-hydrolase [Eupransor demetentiae]|uniref:Beta-lactamase superfamily II (GloB) n=1 Tax=Eupransor demetentiae TaxID=3109584 RepID=A0ABP0EPX9_9LACO|nr:Glyoxylase or a related metal-dependent hydrolase [Lactobacillaceae bacterium LMG 33000]
MSTPSKIKLVAILDSGHTLAPSFLMNRRTFHLRTNRIPALVFLLHHDDLGYILFDTGYGPAFKAATKPFLDRFYRWVTPVKMKPEQLVIEQLKQHGLTAADIKLVILSHLHADHVAGLPDFPQAKLLYPKAEGRYVNDLKHFDQVRHGYLRNLLVQVNSQGQDLAGYQKQAPFDEGGLTVVDLPGHSRGMVGLRFVDQSTQEEILLAADAAWTHAEIDEVQNGPLRIAGIIMYSWPLQKESLKKVRAIQAEGVRVILSHEERESQWFN